MKKILMSVVAAILTVVGMTGIATLSPAYVSPVYADADDPAGTGTGTGTGAGAGGGTGLDWNAVKPDTAGTKSLPDMAKQIINIVIGLVGVVAVVVMILGGISFITSQGDTNKVTKARNTILYGVVGLIVAILAWAIVNFVLVNVLGVNSNTSGSGSGTGAGTGTGTI